VLSLIILKIRDVILKKMHFRRAVRVHKTHVSRKVAKILILININLVSSNFYDNFHIYVQIYVVLYIHVYVLYFVPAI